jgi:penicillin-binding protein A
MRRWSRFVGLGAAIGIIAALVPMIRGSWVGPKQDGPLARAARAPLGDPRLPDLSGLSLLEAEIHGEHVTAPLSSGRVAELTLDPVVQHAVLGQMRYFKIPEAGVVMMDVRTGRLLVYASQVKEGTPFDVNARASAPAASVFKVITGAALIERAALTADSRQCYHGGKSRILAEELEDNETLDKSCVTLGEAMGRSLNVVFGKLARKHLSAEDVVSFAGAFGFGAPVPFAVQNEAPRIEMPTEPLEFARAAAGFWHTTLSPLAAAVLAQTVASSGVSLQPIIVSKILDHGRPTWEDGGEPQILRRAVKTTTASELSAMMSHTVKDGSARAAFVDRRGNPYLTGIDVAGKTGTLTKYDENRHYTWFVGFAPADKPEVAVAALVVNTPAWRIKAPDLARDALRAYFAKNGRRGVTMPQVGRSEPTDSEPSPPLAQNAQPTDQ